MPRPALTEKQRRATRRRIRDAAARLHAEDGRASVSVRAVAERAGVSVGTLYSYFSSLSELMQSLWRSPAARLVGEMEQTAAAEPQPAARLRALLRCYVRFAVVEGAVFRGAFLYVRPESHPPPEQVSLADDRLFSVLRRAIFDGQRSGAFRAGDPDRLTQVVLSAVHGALALPHNMHRLALDSSDEVPSQMIDVMLEWLSSAAPTP